MNTNRNTRWVPDDVRPNKATRYTLLNEQDQVLATVEREDVGWLARIPGKSGESERTASYMTATEARGAVTKALGLRYY